MRFKLSFLSGIIAVGLLAGCGGDQASLTEAPPIPTTVPAATPTSAPTKTPEAPTPQAVPTAAPTAAPTQATEQQPSSPLLQPSSPLQPPSPLPSPFVTPEVGQRPDEVTVMFYSTRDNGPGWYSVRADGTGLQRLAALNAGDLQWVPPLNAFLAGENSADGSVNYRLVDLTGKTLSVVTNDWAQKSDASFSVPNQAFVYVCMINDLDICTVKLGETEFTNLTDIRTNQARPQWSPDGQKILFLSDAAGIPNIWVMNPDGSDLQNLSQESLGASLFPEGNASWSPDGKQIVFESQRDYNSEIYVMDASGDNARNLTENPAVDLAPQWSPDGKLIAFQSDRDNGNDIYVVDLASGQATNVTKTPQVPERQFVWSPDGKQLQFEAAVDEGWDIYGANLEDGEVINLTGGEGDNFSPQWIGWSLPQ